MRGISLLIGAAALSAAATAQGQVIYEGVRYQWGQHGQVFYGGVSPERLPTAALQTPGARLVGQPFTTPHLGRPLIYTDALPWREAGHIGFRIDDARNEAYANVPLLQTAAHYRAEEPAPLAHDEVYDPRWRAVPLLNWARRESANPHLREALLRTAARYDPDAARRLRDELRER